MSHHEYRFKHHSKVILQQYRVDIYPEEDRNIVRKVLVHRLKLAEIILFDGT